MASLQARHARTCVLAPWSTFEAAADCGCGPTYYVTVREVKKIHRERVGKNRKQAERALTKRQAQVDDGAWAPQKSIRFREWGERWRLSLERKETTKSSYRSTIAYAERSFGEKIVRRIGTADIARFLELLRDEGMSDSTRAKHLRVIGACLSSAIEHGYAGQNPVRSLPRSERPRSTRKESAYFEADELPRLFAEIEPGVFRILLLFLLKTGCRVGEASALEWGDVDLTGAAVHVRRGITDGHLSTPKNHERRVVDLPPDLVRTLGEWWGECGKPADDVIVFAGGTASGHLDPSTIRRELYGAMQRAGIPREGPTGERRTVHSLRHTFASRALQSGRPITWLSRHLGHATLEITASTYGHWERAEQKRQAEKMEGVFGV